MKQVAQLALHRSPGYVKVWAHELEVLDTLPLWMERVFRVLLQISSRQTGLGQATYEQIVDRCAPLQPARGGRKHYAPDAWAVWRALKAFERSHIVWRNTDWSQVQGVIVFEVAPRVGQPRPKASSAPGLRTPPTSPESEQRRGL